MTSQPQLVELLAADGIDATQATVSRDLEDLGAVKVRVPAGESVYAIPEYEPDRIAPEDQLRRVWPSGWPRSRTPGRSSSCGRRPAAPTSSPRPSTGPA